MNKNTSDFPWFAFFPRDWMTSESVSSMSFEERGIFVHFLCLAWISKDCTIPADDITLACMIGKIPPEIGRVLTCFPIHPKRPDRRWNKRLMREWDKVKKRSTQATEAIAHRWATVKKRPPRRHPTPRPIPTVPELIEELKQSPLYTHVNIPREFVKAENWIKEHPGRKLTKSFMVQWLNKIEPPLSNGHAHTLTCPHHPTLTFSDHAAKSKHDAIHHPKYVG